MGSIKPVSIGSRTQNFDVSITPFQVTPVWCPMFKEFATQTRQKEQVPAKKRLLPANYTEWIDSPMTAKNASLEQDKKLGISRFQHTIFLSVRMREKSLIVFKIVQK